MIGINLSFTLLLLIPLLLVMAALEVARASGARQWKRPGAITSAARPALGRLVRLLAATAAACLAFDVALRAGWGIDLARIFFTALRIQHEHLLPGIDRTYWLWLFYNVYDYLLLAGPALAALGAMYLARAAHRAWHGPRWIVPAWAFFPIAIVLLDLSGLTPAETSRVWLFLAPGMAWAGAAALALRPPRDWRVNLALLLFIQCATLYVMRAHISFISI
jgi:hypothetical protein